MDASGDVYCFAVAFYSLLFHGLTITPFAASARKRIAQGPHSPSSTNKDRKRRPPDEEVTNDQSTSTVHDSGVSNKENSNLNFRSAPSTDRASCQSTVITQQAPQPYTADRPFTPSPHSTRQVDLLCHFSEENVMSPSQRRLRRLNLAQGGGEVIRPLQFYRGHRQMDSRVLDTSESSMLKESRRAVSVTVPDINDLDIPKPSWYTQNSATSHVTTSNDAATNTNSTVEKVLNPVPLAGVKNLMQSFDEAGGDDTGDVPPPTPGMSDYSLLDNEDSDDDGPSHIGEYLSDDEDEQTNDSLV
ncbi:hypothetical protein DCAR_0623335 [Daucus carota subsp. sativus]|uniref:Uncharacterized protein n=1 Tax=Daucus carota subsp. sativus TaxID=79200 RepID=A0A175YC17_DAUCS|nr:hypothetical protein DCAR_0623335 [Daucus carota subsp. sativus]